jgi:hypothetical protein
MTVKNTEQLNLYSTVTFGTKEKLPLKTIDISFYFFK